MLEKVIILFYSTNFNNGSLQKIICIQSGAQLNLLILQQDPIYVLTFRFKKNKYNNYITGESNKTNRRSNPHSNVVILHDGLDLKKKKQKLTTTISNSAFNR